MIPPTVTPTTGSTTLSPYSINLAVTTSEQDSSPLPPTPPHQPGIDPASLKGILNESQEKPESPSNTALTLPAHNTFPRSIASIESFPNPLPGNLTSCPPVELIFARGTGESSGLGRIGIALYTELMKEYPDMTAYGVFYDASAYKGKLISGGKLEEGGKDIEGRVGMWVKLEVERGQCKETRIVLGGFSLGAAVLQKTKLSPEEQERVDAVVIFGYPWKLRPHKRAQYPLDSEKVWTKCIHQDPVCNVESILTDGTFVAHKGYVEYVEEAVEFIRKKVQKVGN
ncbi:cutinase-domain-containing protein [Terfezia claveryi]|nr:cutinase-domain-containing protein [Terfezia claveryi]